MLNMLENATDIVPLLLSNSKAEQNSNNSKVKMKDKLTKTFHMSLDFIAAILVYSNLSFRVS